jgi:hypothetical protein
VTHEEQAAIILGRAAQYEPAHVLEFKEQMLEREGRTGNDLKDGLEIREDSPSRPQAQCSCGIAEGSPAVVAEGRRPGNPPY